jgi:hypothetical protein
MRDFGYDIEDFKDVDESFGSLQDFKDLVQALRMRGKHEVTVIYLSSIYIKAKIFLSSCLFVGMFAINSITP